MAKSNEATLDAQLAKTLALAIIMRDLGARKTRLQ